MAARAKKELTILVRAVQYPQFDLTPYNSNLCCRKPLKRYFRNELWKSRTAISGMNLVDDVVVFVVVVVVRRLGAPY